MDPASVHPVASPTDLAGRVRSLIDARDVTVVFQPIVDLQDGLIAAFEALTRPGTTGSFKHAGELFHAAEEAGLLWDLECLTRQTAFDAALGWSRETRLFMNCTPQVLADVRFPETASDAVRATSALDPSQVVLEITELSDDQMFAGLADQVRMLKQSDFSIAIDDVGAGTSGMNRIMLLRPHWLKLDREFIAGIHADELKQNLVRFFVHFARLSGVNVIAEGIETREELALVISLGVRFGQGYYLARPVPRETTIAPTFADEVRQRWASVEAEAVHDPGFATLGRLCQSVRTVQTLTTVASAAAAILPSVAEPGFVVLEGRRFVGWCSRSSILREAGGNRAADPIVGITSPGICTLPPDATIHDALQVICVRQDEELTGPVVVADNSEIVGIVTLRDVLQAAAAGSGQGSSTHVALTGLPTRLMADRHLTEMIQRVAGCGPAEQTGDAAVIDIRRFGDFNAAFGYQLGDKLIRRVGEFIRSIVVAGSDDTFVAHLGDDRFLVTSRTESLRGPLEALAADFDRRLDPLADDGDQAPPPLHSLTAKARVSLRMLLMARVFGRLRGPRDFYRIEQQLRQKCRAAELAAGPGKSVLVEDTRAEDMPIRANAAA